LPSNNKTPIIITRRKIKDLKIEQKLKALGRIYEIYDAFAADLDVACQKHCARCCTRNVTLTTVEAYKILNSLASVEKARLVQCISRDSHRKRFQPQVTTNRIAELCLQGEPLPQEASDENWGVCPVLEDATCPLYPHRPFGCRCFVSKVDCRRAGCADVDAYTLTVNNIFHQIIEHLDAGGRTGNFSDVLLWLSSDENRRVYQSGRPAGSGSGLIANYPLKVLMIPPEHRPRAEPLIQKIRSITI
jgi:hypothetical protein